MNLEATNDLGPADNQPIESTVVVKQYGSFMWHLLLPPNAPVFTTNADKIGYHGRDGRTVITDYNHCLNPVQLNFALHAETLRRMDLGEEYTPQMAAAEWRFRGINTTPAPIDANPYEPNRDYVPDRTLVLHLRADSKIDDYWGNVTGNEEHCFFVFKYAPVEYFTKPLVLSGTDTLALPTSTSKNNTPVTHSVQVFAMRSKDKQLTPEQLSYSFYTTTGELVRGIGVAVYAGRCIRNVYHNPGENDVKRYEVDGVRCTDAVSAGKRHIDFWVCSS